MPVNPIAIQRRIMTSPLHPSPLVVLLPHPPPNILHPAPRSLVSMTRLPLHPPPLQRPLTRHLGIIRRRADGQHDDARMAALAPVVFAVLDHVHLMAPLGDGGGGLEVHAGAAGGGGDGAGVGGGAVVVVLLLGGGRGQGNVLCLRLSLRRLLGRSLGFGLLGGHAAATVAEDGF